MSDPVIEGDTVWVVWCGYMVVVRKATIEHQGPPGLLVSIEGLSALPIVVRPDRVFSNKLDALYKAESIVTAQATQAAEDFRRAQIQLGEFRQQILEAGGTLSPQAE